MVVWHVPRGWDLQFRISVRMYSFLLRPGTSLCYLSIQPPFIWVVIPSARSSECTTLGMSCAMPGTFLMLVCGGIELCIYWFDLRFDEAKIWCVSRVFMTFWNVIPKWGPLWCVCLYHRRICLLNITDPRYQLLVCTMSLILWSIVGIPSWVVSDCVGTGVLTHHMTCPWGGKFSRFIAT